MKLVSLSQVSHLLYPGVTLAWSVRDANGTLLLAKGHVLADERAVQTLLDRGMFIDAAEIAAAAAANRAEAPKDESMSGRWSGLENRLGTLLKSSTEPNFLQKVRESVVSIAALADGNVDLLIFLILRHNGRVGRCAALHHDGNFTTGQPDIAARRVDAKPVDPRLITRVAPAVARAAMKSGVARKPILD